MSTLALFRSLHRPTDRRHADIADANDGVFLAEKLVNKLLPRLKHEAALKEIYLERHAE